VSSFTRHRQPEKRRIREKESPAASNAGVFLAYRQPPEKLGERGTRRRCATSSAHVEAWPRSACSFGELTDRDVFRVSSGDGSPEGTVAKTMLRRENPRA